MRKSVARGERKERSQRSLGWSAFSGLCVMLVIWSGIEWYCMSLYADPIIKDLGVTRTSFMLCLSLMAGISALMSLTSFGRLEQRFGVRKLVLFGSLLDTVAFLILAAAQSLPLLYLGSIIYGFGASLTGYNMTATAINHWFKRRRASMVGLANTMGSLSGIIFSPIIAVLIGIVGWRMSFMICFCLSAVGMVTFFFLYRGNPDELGVDPLYSDESENERSIDVKAVAQKLMLGIPYSQAIRTVRFWILALAYFVIGAASYGIMGTMPLFAVDFGYSALQGVVVSVSLIASAVMLTFLGSICDRFGSKWGLTICCAAVVVAAVLLRMDVLPVIGLMVASACSGIAYNSTIVPVSVSIREAFGEIEYSKKLGVCSGCATVGMSAGPIIASLFYDLTGDYRLILLVFAALCVVSAVVFHFVTRPSKTSDAF